MVSDSNCDVPVEDCSVVRKICGNRLRSDVGAFEDEEDRTRRPDM
jgi:hypothetical protein